ncbi:MAG: hypothetical protein ACJAS4_001576 [Bacteriovoracaceae bacterium]|jgi:hypothetical protein
MKNLLMAVIAFASLSTFAANEYQSWDEIKSEVNSNMKLSFDGAGVFAGRTISRFDVCVEGENLKTTKPYAKYERVYVGRNHDSDSNRDGYMTVQTGTEIIVYPLTWTNKYRKCANNGKRCRFVSEEVTTELVKDISVKKLIKKYNKNPRKNVYKTLFTKSYEIPACN